MHSINHNHRRSNTSTGPNQQGPPCHTDKQRELVLELLRRAGPSGIHKQDFIEGKGLVSGHGKITQPAARVWELENEHGYKIEHRIGDDGFTVFILRAQPLMPPAAPPKHKPATQANLEFQTFIGFEMGARR